MRGFLEHFLECSLERVSNHCKYNRKTLQGVEEEIAVLVTQGNEF